MGLWLLGQPMEASNKRSWRMEYSRKTVHRPALRHRDDAQCLLEAFGEAVQELVKLHELQFLAILDGDSNASRFDLLIHYANERKQNAKYAYLQRLETQVAGQTK
jgi:hypothetical protein